MRRVAPLLLALLAPATAHAGGVVSVGDEGVIFGLGLMVLDGTRPGASGAALDFEERSFWLQLRGGSASGDATDLGSRIGFEIDLRLGITPPETSPVRGDIVPLEAAFGLSLAIRAFTWNWPFHGQVVLHLGPEGGLGGAYWWSDTPRLSMTGGARLCVETETRGRAELEWTVAPFTATGSPRDLDVDHLEHRLSITAGIDGFGIGARLLLGRERTRAGESGPRETTWSRAAGIFLEVRG